MRHSNTCQTPFRIGFYVLLVGEMLFGLMALSAFTTGRNPALQMDGLGFFVLRFFRTAVGALFLSSVPPAPSSDAELR